MKNQAYLLSILFSLFCIQISGQSNPKYGILFTCNGVPCKNQKKEFVSFLKSIECIPANSRMEDPSSHILCMGNDLYNGSSIKGVYRVIEIIKKKDNFFLYNKKLKKQTIYIIKLYRVEKDSTLPLLVRLISFKQNSKNGSLIEKDMDYQLSLFQIYGDDFTKALHERYLAVGDGPQKIFYYKTVFIKHLEAGATYYVESPNVKGLYYTVE